VLRLAATVVALTSLAHAEPAKLENGKALDTFRSALKAQKAGKAEHPLRISYFGDSLTADDRITDALRTKLQALLGDGGAGFVFAAPPHPYCEHHAVSRYVSDDWDSRGISHLGEPDKLLGLGGSAETVSGGTIRLAPKGAVKTLDLHYLAQPHGGSVDVACDGKVLSTIATTADKKTSAFSSTNIPDGTKRIELRARGHVRLFGETLESSRGVVVDNLGVVNATAKQMRRKNLEEHWRNQLAHRAPDLVVIMYGTNEAGWLSPKSRGIKEHEKVFGELLATVRAANPNGACLVVSPLDQIDWTTQKPRASIAALVDAQRRAALAGGCAFWDVYTWMGGAGSSLTWFKHGMLMKDFIHPTAPGAKKLGDALYEALVTD
jgi:lysophospholipase L1-like esterase